MKVCVIGAGPSGLTAAKACLEGGLEPTILEARTDLGGRFAMGSVGPCWSKDLTAFSDFPPVSLPLLPPPAAMVSYLHDYAAHFRLPPIHTGCKVTQITPHQDSRWKVTATSQEKGSCTELYDAVLVCTGRIPPTVELPGQDLFCGPVLHTLDVDSRSDFRNQRVLVVGLDNGGLETACRLASVAAQVYLSVHQGAWVLPRLSESGSPNDLRLLSRWAQLLPRRLWLKLFSPVPLGPPSHAHPPLLVSRDLWELLLSGTLRLCGPLKALTSRGAEFVTGESCKEVDCVVVAAGYGLHFPFLDPGLVSVEKDRINLYKHVFPAQLPGSRPTLAFIGTVDPSGPRPPVAELQARWVVSILTGKGAGLPDAKSRWTEVSDRALKAAMQGLPALHADWVAYLDELAALVGVQPPWLPLLLGPCLPYQFRLRGPHAWSEAAQTLAASSTPHIPLRVLPPPPPSRHPAPISIFRILIFALLLLVLLAASAT